MQFRKVFFAVLLLGIILATGCTGTTGNAPSAAAQKSVKEFYMDSFYTIEDGKPHPQFSLKEIVVNKGDSVRIYVNATKGKHDFTIDEYGIYKETPTGNVTTIEFTADKAGEFVYYCAQPGHRQNGQWGTLKVVEKS